MNQSIPTARRLSSLDAFRGITIAGMILVNNPGSWSHVYAPLRHADWNGWTPTDLVFPFFLFIVGVAMAFSFPKQLSAMSEAALYLKVLRRTVIIFLLGLLLHAFPKFDLANLRIAGVLARIAVVYGLASIVVLNTSVAGQAAAAVVLLLGYWFAMIWIPVPGYGRGVLTPEGNLAAYVDSLLLPGRMYQKTWDPEGILSTFPAVATTLLGVLTGHWIRSGRDRRELAAWMFVAGWGAILLGLFWGNWFPINKNIWTSSYVVFTAGAALQFLGVCYWLIDVQGHRAWFVPAIVLGMNSISVYVMSGLFGRILGIWSLTSGGKEMNGKQWIYTQLSQFWDDPTNASLAFALAYVGFWFLVMSVFYRFGVFIKV